MLDIEAPNLDEYEPSGDVGELVSDVLTQLLKLGLYVGKQPKVRKAVNDRYRQFTNILNASRLILLYYILFYGIQKNYQMVTVINGVNPSGMATCMSLYSYITVYKCFYKK